MKRKLKILRFKQGKYYIIHCPILGIMLHSKDESELDGLLVNAFKQQVEYLKEIDGKSN